MQGFFETLPIAASHPFALVAYICVLAAWVYNARTVQRNKNLLNKLQNIPEKDRARIVAGEMGFLNVPKGLSGNELLRRERQKQYLIAFIVFILAIVVVVAITLSQSTPLDRVTRDAINMSEELKAAKGRLLGGVINDSRVECYRGLSILDGIEDTFSVKDIISNYKAFAESGNSQSADALEMMSTQVRAQYTSALHSMITVNVDLKARNCVI